jgi:hypothetical protein
VQRKTARDSQEVASVPDHFVRSLGPGKPLDSAARAFFEPRLVETSATSECTPAAGVASAYAELSGGGDDAPGVLQIYFGSDAEK